MLHSPNIEKAIKTAALLHKNQVRKGSIDYPYISHPFSVALILSQYTDDEDIIIAGLLHDTIEDTDYTAQELEKDFGSRIQQIVLGVTEQKTKDGVRIAWVQRKKGYIQGLRGASEESLYVSAADKIHNFQSTLDLYSYNEKGFRKDFEKQDRVAFYGTVVDVIVKRLGADHPLVIRLQDVFDKYKIFLGKVYT